MELSPSAFKTIVANTLARRERTSLHGNGLIPSAVLMVFFQKDDRLWLLLTKRTDFVAHHKNEVSFPGGCRDPEDESLLHTALRECAEEIGLHGPSVEILGALDDTPTASSNFVITPYVAFMEELPQFVLCEDEVAELVEFPLEALLDPDNLREASISCDGETMTVSAYHYQAHTVWGATARLISQFVDLMRPSLAQYHSASTSGRKS